MNILFIGDVYSKIGREILLKHLDEIRNEYSIDFTIANIENLAGGVGVTPKTLAKINSLNIDVYTSGNHIWDKKEIFPYLEENECNIVIPVNYPEIVKGKRVIKKECYNNNIYVLCAQGRVFMPPIDCPFWALKREIEKIKEENNEAVIIIDFHAEATSEKKAMGYFLDGKVSAVLGTHTHIQTADEQILPNGTAYITDVGMTGPFHSVIGVEKDVIIQRFLTAGAYSERFKASKGAGILNAVVIKIDETNGKAINIKRIYKVYDKKS